MARLNIEDSIWSDARFLKLCIKLKDERTAVGAVVLAWKLAQKHHKTLKVPLAEWIKSGIGTEIIEVGLAEETKEGIYVCGSKEHFAWYSERVEAAKAGGVRRTKTVHRDGKGRFQPKPSQTLDVVQPKPSQTLDDVQPSISISSSSSISISNSEVEEEGLSRQKLDNQIHSELLGIQDDFFRRLTLGAQEGWLKKFGVELIRQHVPLFYSAYVADKPKDKWGNPKSAVFYINNCLEIQAKQKANGHCGDYTADDLAVIFGGKQ